MSANKRFYEYNDKYTYDRIIARKVKEGMVTEDDGNLLLDYIGDKLAKGQIEERRAQRLSTMLTQWRRFIEVPYREMTFKDLLRGVNAERKSGDYKQSTLRSNIKGIKTFTNWMRKRGIVNISSDDLDEVKPPKEVFDSIKPSDLLTDDQVDKIIDSCTTIRDKAIISILSETGLRPVDVGGLLWRDLDFNRERVKISITTEKTTTPISVYVVLRKSWLVEHRKAWSGAKDKDYVFLEHDSYKPITYKGITHILERAAMRAGVKLPKGAKSKLFRAGAITNGIRNGYSTVVISKMAWGSPDSRMLRHYAKLVDEDQEREVLRKTGVLEEAPSEPRKRIPCPECGEPLTPGIKFCPMCSCALTKDAIEQKKLLEAEVEEAARKDRDAMEARIAKLEALLLKNQEAVSE